MTLPYFRAEGLIAVPHGPGFCGPKKTQISKIDYDQAMGKSWEMNGKDQPEAARAILEAAGITPPDEYGDGR